MQIGTAYTRSPTTENPKGSLHWLVALTPQDFAEVEGGSTDHHYYRQRVSINATRLNRAEVGRPAYRVMLKFNPKGRYKLSRYSTQAGPKWKFSVPIGTLTMPAKGRLPATNAESKKSGRHALSCVLGPDFFDPSRFATARHRNGDANRRPTKGDRVDFTVAGFKQAVIAYNREYARLTKAGFTVTAKLDGQTNELTSEVRFAV